MKYFAMLAVLVVAIACGGKKEPGTFVAPDGGTAGRAPIGTAGGSSVTSDSGSGGTDEMPDGGGEAGATEINRLAPVVKITAPTQVDDPNTGMVLTDAQINVVCTASASREAGAQKVLTSSLKIQMFGADGKEIGMDGTVHSTSNVDEYAATFTLTAVPSGAVSFKCSASDTATNPNTATATVATFVDHGPAITLTNPAPNSAHAISPAILFNFSAQPAPLNDADKSADVTTVTLAVNGVNIDGVAASEIPSTPGVYQISIDLNNTSLFTPTPTKDVPVRIVATNKRGTVATGDFSFNVDSVGPVISIVSPVPNSFIGGKVTLSFTVTDSPAGVDPSTVQVKLNNQTGNVFDPAKMWSMMGSTFYYTFDTTNFKSVVQLSVNILASDLAGNASNGISVIYNVDNVPPILDLDPPKVQEAKYLGTNPVPICSEPFDPLGDDAPNDLQVIPSVNTFRALLWDIGNVADGQHISYFSDINNSDTNTVPHLYFQADTSKPIVKNSDPTTSGAVCNAISDETLPLLTLVQLPPSTTSSAYYDSQAPSVTGCGVGNDTQPPAVLCQATTMTRVIQHDSASTDPAVPVVYVLQHDGSHCTGGEVDITNLVHQNGWVCAAVSAVDNTGNRAVSAPLRLCLNSVNYPEPDCAKMSTTPPTCVDNCVPPPHFSQKVVTIPHT